MTKIDFLINSKEEIENFYAVTSLLTQQQDAYGIAPVYCIYECNRLFFPNAAKPVVIVEFDFNDFTVSLNTNEISWKGAVHTARHCGQHFWIPLKDMNNMLLYNFVNKHLDGTLGEYLFEKYEIHHTEPYN